MAYRNLYIKANNVFKNRTFDDLLKPLAMYTDVYNQLEAESGELADKSNAFAYLSSTLPEGSESKRIYENYANELKAASDDMARNGLNIQNRKALVDLKRRYNGEIGRLQRADEALQREKELRRNASMRDPSMLYANDNLTIDNFLEGSNPNLYGISGNDLYKRGATASQQASSRVYDNTQVQNLTKYYQEMIQRYGYNPELLYAFREDLSAIPELEAEVDSILKETGVEDNLTGNNYARARESVINGMIDGALYKEERKAMQNPGVLTAAQAAQDARQRESTQRQVDVFNFGLLQQGFTRDDKGNIVPMQNNPLYTTDENGRIKLRDDIDPSKFGISSSGNLTYGNGKGGNNGDDLSKIPAYTISEDGTPVLNTEGTQGMALLNRAKDEANRNFKNVKHGNKFTLKVGNQNFEYEIIGGVKYDHDVSNEDLQAQKQRANGNPNFKYDFGWVSGYLGEDLPNRFMGYTNSNVVDWYGDFSTSDMFDDKDKGRGVRILKEEHDATGAPTPRDDFQFLDNRVRDAIETLVGRYKKDNGLHTSPTYEVIEVPSEGGSRPHYLVAIKTN